MNKFLRIPFAYDSDSVGKDNSLVCPEESLTRQEFKEESDINTIISRFGIGEHPVEAGSWTTNIDIVEATTDFQSAMNQLNQAQAEFMSLPARIRSQFDNDPALFVDFMSDPANQDEWIRMGLAVDTRPPVAPEEPGTLSS